MKRLYAILLLASCTPVDLPQEDEALTKADTTEVITASGVPITFDVGVEGWKEISR